MRRDCNGTSCFEGKSLWLGIFIFGNALSHCGSDSGSVGFKQPEFQVNTMTPGYQVKPVVAMDGVGGFLVLWANTGLSPVNANYWARRYGRNGNPIGSEMSVVDSPGDHRGGHTVAMNDSGQSVLAWITRSELFARRYLVNGEPLDTAFRVADTFDYHSAESGPSIALADSGDFLVVWQRARFSLFIVGKLYGRSMSTKEFIVSKSGYNAYNPATDTDSEGNFVVAWQSREQDGDYYGIFCRRFDHDGVALGGEFQVNTLTQGRQWDPAIAVDDAGSFVVTWTNTLDLRQGREEIRGQRYDSFGGRLGGEFILSDVAAGVTQRNSSVAMDGKGNFLVSWINHKDGMIYARSYDNDGRPDAAQFKVSQSNTNSVFLVQSSVAMNRSGGFVFVWERDNKGDSSWDVFGRR